MAKKLYDREFVLEAALELAKETGFDRLSIRGIARKLNTSVSPVYDSFESKHEIIQAIIVKVFDENANSDCYFERNQGILSYGLKYPMLYRDIQLYTRKYYLETTHVSDVRKLMQNEHKLKGFPDNVLRSLNFDILLYISGLVQLRLSDAVNDFDIAFYKSSLKAATELLILGYKHRDEAIQ